MQTVDRSGILGDVQKVTKGALEKALKDPDVDHVDIFEGTEENIKRRKSLIGKKYKFKRYRKAPTIQK